VAPGHQGPHEHRELLLGLAQLISERRSLAGIFEAFAQGLLRAATFDYASLSTFASDRRFMRFVGSYPAELQPGPERALPSAIDMGVEDVLPYQDGVEYVPLHVAAPRAQTMATGGLRRAWSIVLLHDGIAQGMFTVGRARSERFSDDDRAFLCDAARLLSGAVFEEAFIETARQDAARNRILSELSIQLNAGEPVGTLFERLRSLLAEAIEFDYLDLFIEERPGMMRIVGSAPQVYKAPGELEPAAAMQLDQFLAEGLPATQCRSDRVSGPWTNAFASHGIVRVAVAMLKQASDIFGVIDVGRRQNLAYTEQEMTFLGTVATLLAQAVANQRRIARSQADARRAHLLNELAVLINAGEPVEALFDRIRATVHQAINFDFLSVHVATENRLRLVGIEPAIPLRSNPERTPGEVGINEVLRGDTTSAQFRPEDYGAPAMRVLVQAGMRRALAVRLGEPGLQAGALTFARTIDSPFDERDVSFVELLGQFVSQAIANHNRIEASELEAQEQRIVAHVAAVVAAATDWNTLVAELVEPLRAFVPRPYSALGYIDGNRVIYPIPGGEPVSRPIGKYARLAMMTGQAVVTGLPADSTELESSRHFGVQTLAITPCLSNGKTVGFFLAGSRRDDHTLSDRDLRLIRLTAQISGPAIANMLTSEQTERERTIYNRALDSLSEAVILLDHDLRTVFSNKLGRTIGDAVDPERRFRTVEAQLHGLPEDMHEPFVNAFVKGQVQRGRTQLTLAGAPSWLDYEFIPLDDPNVRLLVVASDVTADVLREQEREQHRAEMEQAARLAALGGLIGGVAHELNNPLTAILGFAELLANAPETGAQGDEITIIRKEALRARDIVRDLLFIARPGSVELGDVLLGEVVGHIERLRRPEWTTKGITVEIERHGLERPLRGNEHQLTQVLLNLITNAEYAVSGVPEPRITIRAAVDEVSAVLEVEDNGEGMDAATVDRVFEPFFTTKQGEGTGLGLSLSRTIVKAHGGRIEARSIPGEGTRFIVTVPAPARIASDRTESAPQQPGAPASVLLVDDEPSLRALVQRLVSRMGHRCSVAADAHDALALAAANDFDLVICDYRLAGETADAVVEGLLDLSPRLRGRVVLATGATTDPGVVALTQRYDLPLLPKPYGVGEIAAVLDSRGRMRTAG